MVTTSRAQDHDHTEDHSHHEHRNEVSIAIGPSWQLTDNSLAGAVHLHYIRGLGKGNRFGVGAGLEAIIGQHMHYSAAAIFHVRIYRGLLAGYAPGISLVIEDGRTAVQFAQHVEWAMSLKWVVFTSARLSSSELKARNCI